MIEYTEILQGKATAKFRTAGKPYRESRPKLLHGETSSNQPNDERNKRVAVGKTKISGHRIGFTRTGNPVSFNENAFVSLIVGLIQPINFFLRARVIIFNGAYKRYTSLKITRYDEFARDWKKCVSFVSLHNFAGALLPPRHFPRALGLTEETLRVEEADREPLFVVQHIAVFRIILRGYYRDVTAYGQITSNTEF